MSFKDLLKEFRTESMALMLLGRELQTRPEPSLQEAQLPAAVRRARTRSRRQQLMDQQEAVRSRWDVLNEQFEELLKAGGATGAERTILRQFYGSAMTDREIGEMLGCSAKTVCGHRRSWLRRMEKGEA